MAVLHVVVVDTEGIQVSSQALRTNKDESIVSKYKDSWIIVLNHFTNHKTTTDVMKSRTARKSPWSNRSR